MNMRKIRGSFVGLGCGGGKNYTREPTLIYMLK